MSDLDSNKKSILLLDPTALLERVLALRLARRNAVVAAAQRRATVRLPKGDKKTAGLVSVLSLSEAEALLAELQKRKG